MAATLREAGLYPVMSDQQDSGFANPGTTNSIETCLVNLRACERCIVVLSQRYGPSLADSGFDDLSATHLEYREAAKLGIPIAFYVRDRLLAEYKSSRRNEKFTPAWTTVRDAPRLFKFIGEHEKLENTTKDNWVWPFTSAVDLCSRVLIDLGATASAARVRLLAEQGRLPLLQLHVMIRGGETRVTILNESTVNAIRLSVRAPDDKPLWNAESFPGGDRQEFGLHLGIDSLSRTFGHAPVLTIDYETVHGEALREFFAMLPAGDGKLRFLPCGRRIVGTSLRLASPEPVRLNGLLAVPLAPINADHELRSR